MGTIKGKVDKILQIKQQRIAPENIKKDVQIFDIIGTYEGEGYITTDATATSNDILSGETAYVSTGKITGNIQKYINSTITPSKQTQQIAEGFYSGLQVEAVTSSIDSNIQPENIIEGITILNVTGTAKVNPLDATATSSDILENKTAYINTGKVSGIMINQGTLVITPSKQVNITIPQGYHSGSGYVEAVTSSIDSNIIASNIKSGVTILGVTGTLSYLDTSDATANTSTILVGNTAYVNGQKITGTMYNRGTLDFYPDIVDQVVPSGYVSGGTIHAVTNTIDSNIQPGNIKQGVTILGVTGTLTAQGTDTTDADAISSEILLNKTAYVNGQKIIGTMANKGSTTIYPTTYSQTLDPGYYSSISVNSVTSSIDQNIVASNILNGVTILGVTGNVIPSDIVPEDYTIYPSDQELVYEDIYCRTLTIKKADSRVDSNLQPQNIKKDVTILGVTGTLDPQGGVNYESGTLNIVYNYCVNYNPVKQEGSVDITEFDSDGKCIVTNGTYCYIRLYFYMEESEEIDININFTKGAYSRLLFSELDSEMVRGTENVTTNVYIDTNLQPLTNEAYYNDITAGRHFIDVKIITTDSTDINSFIPYCQPTQNHKIVSQIYASTDAMNADLSQNVGTYAFIYSIINKTMISLYRFDGEKWVQRSITDYTGTISPSQYTQSLNKVDELNGEIIGEE